MEIKNYENVELIMKKLQESSDLRKNSYVEGWFNQSQKTPTVPWTYSLLFPEFGVPNSSLLQLNIGIEATQINQMEKLGFVKYYDETDYFIGDNLEMGTEIVKQRWIHPNGYIVNFDLDEEFATDTSLKFQNVKEILKKIREIKKDDDSILGMLERKPRKSSLVKNESVFLSDQIEIYFPSPIFRDEGEHKKMIKSIWEIVSQNEKKNMSGKKEERAEISILVKDSFDTYFKPFDVTKFSNDLKAADTFYGEGFSDFNDKLVQRVTENKKGLVLLHGDPGTGKTHYIRHLLKVFTGKNKRVIFIPSMLIEEMANPETINFLIDDIIASNQDTILLMEDAESLLESRKLNGGRSVGISNLLNSTDGILNDLLGVVIIATFNTDLSNIDEALLRNGRLIARKNFRLHDVASSTKIADILGIKKEFLEKVDKNKLYSIADILNVKGTNETLIHDTIQKNNIGFRK